MGIGRTFVAVFGVVVILLACVILSGDGACFLRTALDIASVR